MKFLDGPLCNGNPSSSIVEFVCLDVLGAGLADWGTRTPMIYSASRSQDGCSVNLTLPLPGACDGGRFDLCGSALASPNPTPTTSPTFTYSSASLLSWAPGRILAQMPGTVPPPAVRVQLSGGVVVSTGFEPEGPGPLPPSASPIPVPFPNDLQIIGMFPQKGIRGQCTEVTVRRECFSRRHLCARRARKRSICRGLLLFQNNT